MDGEINDRSDDKDVVKENDGDGGGSAIDVDGGVLATSFLEIFTVR